MPDQIVRCLLATPAIRIVAACTTETGRETARRHGAVGGVAAALSRASTAGLLLATLTKHDERVTLQILGGGPMGAITVDANSSGGARAFVKNPTMPIPALAGARVPLGRFVGRSGVVSVARDLGMRESFSGQTEIIDGEIDTDVEHYLVTSEQIDSALGCEAILGEDLDIVAAAGVLVQALPGGEAAALIAEARERLRKGALAQLLASGTQLTAEQLAVAIVGDHADDLRVIDTRPVHFRCPCSRERAAATLTLIGVKEMESLREEDGGATVACDFCGASYHFSPGEIDRALGPSA